MRRGVEGLPGGGLFCWGVGEELGEREKKNTEKEEEKKGKRRRKAFFCRGRSGPAYGLGEIEGLVGGAWSRTWARGGGYA